LFYTAYILAAPATTEARPIIFAFNGGPGAASVYLHLARWDHAARRSAAGRRGTPPLVDNAETWLGLGDLVFVDPAGTGLSRATMADGSPGDQAFWETDADIDAMYRFIIAYVARFARDRPIYLVGESYGGFRAARLADSLSKLATIRLAGVVLISPAIDRGAMADDRMMRSRRCCACRPSPPSPGITTACPASAATALRATASSPTLRSGRSAKG